MGALYYQEQEWEKAYAAYEILVDLAPSNPKLDEFECSLRFGVSAVKTNRLQEAIKGFLLARKIKTDDFEVAARRVAEDVEIAALTRSEPSSQNSVTLTGSCSCP